MDGTARLGLPLISPGQAQKEIWHNESLQSLDILVAGAVEEPPRIDPPASPAVGSCYIVAPGATGEWVDRPDQLACFTSGGWRYVLPVDGVSVHVRSTGEQASYRAGAWELGRIRGAELVIGGNKVVGGRTAAIANPAGGATADNEARSAIEAILGALRSHGLIAT